MKKHTNLILIIFTGLIFLAPFTSFASVYVNNQNNSFLTNQFNYGIGGGARAGLGTSTASVATTTLYFTFAYASSSVTDQDCSQFTVMGLNATSLSDSQPHTDFLTLNGSGAHWFATSTDGNWGEYYVTSSIGLAAGQYIRYANTLGSPACNYGLPVANTPVNASGYTNISGNNIANGQEWGGVCDASSFNSTTGCSSAPAPVVSPITFNFPIPSSTINYDFSDWSLNFLNADFNATDTYDINVSSTAIGRNWKASDEISGVPGDDITGSTYGDLFGNTLYSLPKNNSWLQAFGYDALGINTTTVIQFQGTITDLTSGLSTSTPIENITFVPNSNSSTYPTAFLNNTSSVYGSIIPTSLFNATSSNYSTSSYIDCSGYSFGLFSSTTVQALACEGQNLLIWGLQAVFVPTSQSLQTLQNVFSTFQQVAPMSFFFGVQQILYTDINKPQVTPGSWVVPIQQGYGSTATTTLLVLMPSDATQVPFVGATSTLPGLLAGTSFANDLFNLILDFMVLAMITVSLYVAHEFINLF